jgi:hypothetical protein
VGYGLASPPAHAMIESLRGVGYSIETAIADLIDNSIAAAARNVWLKFEFDGPDSWISILDDGRGMDERDLRSAMTVGGRSPLDVRDPGDLGRFGMGLKTASFSQCRNLTVASRKSGGTRVTRRWDLDYIARPEINEWRLLTEPRAGSETRLSDLDDVAAGTMVLWEQIDRVTAGLSSDRRSRDAFLALVTRVERHVSMVFHRFLEGPSPRLKVHLNGSARIRGWDPFLTSSPATDISPLERIPSSGGIVELQGFVLPHRDQLSEEAYRDAGGRDGWTSQQGFYVYRNDRMLVAGGWLGLGEPRVWTREEPFKLARLAVNFPNTADADWEVDIRKSVARPPRTLRPRLTALADAVRTEARKVFAHRGSYGRRAPVADLTPAWTQTHVGGRSCYRVNRAHPAVTALASGLPNEAAAMENLLRVIEETVPVQRIWLDTVEQGEVQGAVADEPPPGLEAIAVALYRHLAGPTGLTPALARARLLSTDPFQNYPAAVERALAGLDEEIT